MKKYSDSNVAIVEAWTACYIKCIFSNRYSSYVTNVKNWHEALIDLDDDKKAIRSKVDKYYYEVYLPEMNKIIAKQAAFTEDVDTINSIANEVEREYIRNLCHFIAQTIQDSGLGWKTPGSGKGYYVGADSTEEFIG
jgi:hypothetical protein